MAWSSVGLAAAVGGAETSIALWTAGAAQASPPRVVGQRDPPSAALAATRFIYHFAMTTNGERVDPGNEASRAPRWWLATPGQQPQGPFDGDTVAAMYRQGRIGPISQICLEGEALWRPIASEFGPPLAPPTDPHAVPRFVNSSAWAQRSLVLPILATIFCCLIGGIISIVYTAQANTKGVVGDLAGAERDAKTANTWLVISVVTPVVVMLLYFLVFVGVGLFWAAGAAGAARGSGG